MTPRTSKEIWSDDFTKSEISHGRMIAMKALVIFGSFVIGLLTVVVIEAWRLP